MNNKTKKELWNSINNDNNGKLADFIFYLNERWQEEKEYEDKKDYLLAFKQKVDGVLKISLRPFGFYIRCTDGDIFVYIKKTAQYEQLMAKNV